MPLLFWLVVHSAAHRIGEGWSIARINQTKQLAKEMFLHGFDNYMEHAFPRSTSFLSFLAFNLFSLR